MPTAAAIVIGNEILSGKFVDENGAFLIRRLRALGVDLKRVAVIPDEIPAIAAEVRACAAAFDHVFTSGGVGPTHDDVTFDGIAAAFGVSLEEHPELLGLLRRFGFPENGSTLRMVRVPAGAELIHDEALSYPALKVRNVWVLPGVPRLFKNKFEVIAPRFAAEAVATARLYCTEQEWEIAERLTAVAGRHPGVEIGSYPRFGEGPYHVILTLESRDAAALAQAAAELSAAVAVLDRGAL